jgi:hypothetical protein
VVRQSVEQRAGQPFRAEDAGPFVKGQTLLSGFRVVGLGTVSATLAAAVG